MGGRGWPDVQLLTRRVPLDLVRVTWNTPPALPFRLIRRRAKRGALFVGFVPGDGRQADAKWPARWCGHGCGGPVSGLPSSAAGHPDTEDGSPRAVPLLCQALSPGPARDAAIRLLAGTGDSAAQITSRCQAGAVYALVDVGADPGDPPPAAAVIVAHRDGGMELSDLVAPGPQGSDLTARLLAEMCDALRHIEVSRLVVATGATTVPPVPLLEQAGFRPAGVGVEPGAGWFELRL